LAKSNYDKVRAFAKKYNIPRNDKPRIPETKEFQFRLQLIMEETVELLDAHRKKNLGDYADAIGDLLYVTYGLASLSGIDIDGVFDVIHEANMKKVRARGTNNKRGSKTDVIKPPGWMPPDIAEFIRKQGVLP
jgi:predicted HAD superfamily Cof-like phosphohydrolase